MDRLCLFVASNGFPSGRRRSKHNCTKFHATLAYEAEGTLHRLRVTAGEARGHDQPTSLSDYRIGDCEQVAYDPGNPRRAYRNTMWDIWGAPIITFFVQIAAFVGSMAEKRRN